MSERGGEGVAVEGVDEVSKQVFAVLDWADRVFVHGNCAAHVRDASFGSASSDCDLRCCAVVDGRGVEGLEAAIEVLGHRAYRTGG